MKISLFLQDLHSSQYSSAMIKQIADNQLDPNISTSDVLEELNEYQERNSAVMEKHPYDN